MDLHDEALGAPRAGLPAAEQAELERVSAFLEKKDPVVRLADPAREDRAPAFAPDGRTLFYAARKPGEAGEPAT